MSDTESQTRPTLGYYDEDVVLIRRMWDDLRTAKMNVYYYEARLASANFWNLSFELALAIGATGSGVAGWAIWKEQIYAWIWAIIAGTASLIAIVKPILAPGKKIELATRQHQSWHTLSFGIEKVLFQIRQDGCVSDEVRKRFDTTFDRQVQISLEDEKSVNHRLLRKCQAQVKQALPSDKLWVPEAFLGKRDRKPLSSAGTLAATGSAANPGAATSPGPASPPPPAETISTGEHDRTADGPGAMQQAETELPVNGRPPAAASATTEVRGTKEADLAKQPVDPEPYSRTIAEPGDPKSITAR